VLFIVIILIKAVVSSSRSQRHIGGKEVQLHSFLTSALDEGVRLNSGPGRFAPGKRTRLPFNRRLGEPQNWYGHFGEKIHSFYRYSNPGPSSSSPKRCSEYATPTAVNLKKREMFN
jgi:hypothetical protein